MKKYLLLFILLFSIGIGTSYATHNRAGDITYIHINNNNYSFEFTVTTYTSIGTNVQADRCYLTIDFGDNDTLSMPRLNGPPDSNGQCANTNMGDVILQPSNGVNGVKMNIYKGQHTYAGPGYFVASVSDPNRNEGIVNIPMSVNVAFYISTTVYISPFMGVNSSPILLNPPIDNACSCRKFIHNPGAYDIDNDSLSYALANCQAGGVDIPGYSIPSGVTLNPVTGDFVWYIPCNVQGEYNFAILIISWRNGVQLDIIRRDMQVTVNGACANNPPVVSANDTCVVANDSFLMHISATDPDNNDVNLSSTSYLYTIPDSAHFYVNSGTPGHAYADFSWQPNCSRVRLNPYEVTFKATDVPTNINDVPLADLKTIRITVVSPGPTNLTATPQGTAINLNWTPTVCSQAIGYKIYRRIDASGWQHTHCETGIPTSTGYVQIADVSNVNTTVYTDDNNGQGLDHGIKYCYMIYAYFTDSAKSYASNEDCTTLKKDVPIITRVTVVSTSTAGVNHLSWSPPNRSEIDTISYPGPYKYILYRSSASLCNNLGVIDSIVNVVLPGGTTDTVYTYSGLNTQDNANSYRIELYQTPHIYMGSSNCASSVYLQILPSDNQLTLDWTYNVPWTQDSFYVFRSCPPLSLPYSKIAVTTSTQYTDVGLVNGRQYCYKIKAFGHYSDPSIIKPIINYSQETCAAPIDNIPPCPPHLNVTANCDSIINHLNWNNPNLTCANDVLHYHIYYCPHDTGTFTQVGSIDGASNISFEHNNNDISIAGCYYVTALDSVYNESLHSDTVCVDNCPDYTLPNIFSPNHDGVNDYFKPFPYKYVQDIDIKIYNRWGLLIFSSTDPNILWDGMNQTSHRMSSDGTYYYICSVNEIKLKGIETHNIHGFVQLMSSPNADANH